ncbi:hypothetical protein ACVRWL_09470 [Streptococcus ratti]|nr:hypothetical protein [Streptococcus ratti]
MTFEQLLYAEILAQHIRCKKLRTSQPRFNLFRLKPTNSLTH